VTTDTLFRLTFATFLFFDNGAAQQQEYKKVSTPFLAPPAVVAFSNFSRRSGRQQAALVSRRFEQYAFC
jgi:hypothetical protein